jgi:hypothetical protein
MKLPLVIQARVVKPGKATFGFTNLFPKAVVFEFGIVNDSTYPEFEQMLIDQLSNAGVKYTIHWLIEKGLKKCTDKQILILGKIADIRYSIMTLN